MPSKKRKRLNQNLNLQRRRNKDICTLFANKRNISILFFMLYRFVLVMFLLLIASPSQAKDEEFVTFNSLSHTLESIVKSDTTILTMGYTWKLLERFDIYRDNILQEWKKTYPLIPTVWSKRPSLDTTHLYTPYIQKYSLSCEIAAVKMILWSLWKRRSEEAIYQSIPHTPWALSWGLWWDPDKEFVGYLTWTQWWRTGYGIYEWPLQDYLNKEGYITEITNKTTYTGNQTPEKHLTFLLDKVKLGSRVILWWDWCTSTESEDGILGSWWRWIIHYFPLAAKNRCSRTSEERKFSWKTIDGKNIDALSGEHTFILLGYIGRHDNPTHIIVWDTYTGRHIFSYKEWMRKWELMNYRSLRVEQTGN